MSGTVVQRYFHISTGITSRPGVITAPVMRYFSLLGSGDLSVQVEMAAMIREAGYVYALN